MKCDLNERDSKIDDYLIGVFSENERESFEEHFFNCETCFEQLKLREKMVTLIRKEGKTLFKNYLEGQQNQAMEYSKSTTKKLYWPTWQAPVAWVYIAIITIVVPVGIYLISQNLRYDNILATISYDDKVPFEASSSLRSPKEASESLYTFYNNFQECILNYQSLAYQAAITCLEGMSVTAQRLQKTTGNLEEISIIRDYYFFLGVSYFAITRSKRIAMDDASRHLHLERAIQALSQSQILTQQYNLKDFDRDAYFLGLAYGFSDNHESALVELRKIENASPFYNQSIKLIKKWSK